MLVDSDFNFIENPNLNIGMNGMKALSLHWYQGLAKECVLSKAWTYFDSEVLLTGKSI